MPDPERPEVLLEREAKGRIPAGAAAIVAGALALVGFVVLQTAYRDVPEDDSSKVLFFNDHATQIILGSIVQSLGTLASGYALLYLYQATKGRRPETISVARVCAIGGPIVIAIGQLAVQFVLLQKAHDYATTGSQTYEGAKAIVDDDTLTALTTLGFAGGLALGFAYVIISLNAMRSGLLTRFMGILGIIVGVLLVLPLAPSPIVQTVYLVSVGLIILGRWPNGVPPAWRSGEAEPWPTQQQLREQANAAKAAERGEEPSASASASASASPEPATADGPSAKAAPQKRKRKRKR